MLKLLSLKLLALTCHHTKLNSHYFRKKTCRSKFLIQCQNYNFVIIYIAEVIIKHTVCANVIHYMGGILAFIRSEARPWHLLLVWFPIAAFKPKSCGSFATSVCWRLGGNYPYGFIHFASELEWIDQKNRASHEKTHNSLLEKQWGGGSASNGLYVAHQRTILR